MPREILLIDDDEVDRQAICRALQKAKLEANVTEAASAVAGSAALRAASFDCILLDHRLPDIDGLDFLRTLRAAQGRLIPVVMLTGKGDERTAVDSIRAGAQDYLIKDRISPEDLRRSIAAAIQLVDAENERRAAEIGRAHV